MLYRNILAAGLQPARLTKSNKTTIATGHVPEHILGAGWSSPVARQAHNLKVAGSNPAPATKKYT